MAVVLKSKSADLRNARFSASITHVTPDSRTVRYADKFEQEFIWSRHPDVTADDLVRKADP